MPSTFAIDVRTPDAPNPTVTWTVCHTLADVDHALQLLAPTLPVSDRSALLSELPLLGAFSVAIPAARFSEAMEKKVIEALQRASANLQANMSATP